MENVDTQEFTDHDEEDMFLSEVVGDEHELLAIDSYLRDVFGGGAGRLAGIGISANEDTL